MRVHLKVLYKKQYSFLSFLNNMQLYHSTVTVDFYKPLLSGLPLLRGHLGRSRRCPLNRGLTVLETISGMSRNSPKSYGMRRSKIWTTKFHAPLDFCLSFSLLLVYSIFVPFLAGHLLSFSYIFACLIFRNISFPNNCFLFCVRETMVSR